MIPSDRRALARMVTRLADATLNEALETEGTLSGSAPLIGVTGPPGVGKSTTIARLALLRAEKRGEIAVIAIDPSSPVSGGAILGDRIRMADLADDPRIFIRSLATRGNNDGLSRNLPLILERLRGVFSEILLETVGVGQVEFAARELVDTMVLVIAPGSGDQVQAMKSGILELPDIFIINKSDMPGADRLAGEIGSVVNLRACGPAEWRPPIVSISAERGAGLQDLSRHIDRHQAWLTAGRFDIAALRRKAILRMLVERRIAETFEAMGLPDPAVPLGTAFSAVLAALCRDKVNGE